MQISSAFPFALHLTDCFPLITRYIVVPTAFVNQSLSKRFAKKERLVESFLGQNGLKSLKFLAWKKINCSTFIGHNPNVECMYCIELFLYRRIY
jgi:hypothetical protein